MLFVRVHCDDEADRGVLIPLHKVDKVKLNADGWDSIIVGEESYTPRNLDNFYFSIEDVGELPEKID